MTEAFKASGSRNLQALQICSRDAPPFGHVCRMFEAAAGALGGRIQTVFLDPPTDDPLPSATYLHDTVIRDTDEIVRRLNAFASTPWDLVVCHRYRTYWCAALSELDNKKCVALAHEYGLLHKLSRRLGRRIRGRGVRFAAVAPGIAKELEQVTGEHWVLPNVLDSDNVDLLSEVAAREALGLSGPEVNVGVVGRLHYKKRPALALEVFKRFAALHDKPARLVYIGQGPERSSLESAAPPNVVFCGQVGDAPRYFTALDVLLHTANAEPFGMVALEALNAGVPVVTLNHHGPEYVLGGLGVFAQEDTPQGFAEALERAVVLDRDDYMRAAQERVRERFSVDALARSLSHMLAKR